MKAKRWYTLISDARLTSVYVRWWHSTY